MGMTDEKSPTASGSERQRSASLWLGPACLALALAQSHAWPSRAWPEAAELSSAAYALIAAWAAAMCWVRQAAAPRVWPLAAGALWAAWVVIGVWRVAVPAAGAELGAQAVAGFLVFSAAAAWSSLSAAAPGKEGRQPAARLNRAGTILFGGMTLVAAAVAVHAIWQRYVGYPANLRQLEADPLAFGGEGPFRDAVLYELRLGRPGSVFGAPNICAAFLALGTAMALGLSAAWRKPLGWVWAGLVSALCLFAGALTQSRGGALTFAAAVAGGAALVWRFRPRAGGKPWAGRRALAALGALAVLGVAGGGLALKSSRLGAEWGRRLKAKSTTRERVNYLRVAQTLWSEKPVLGYGAGAFELRYPLYRVAGSGEARDPHNWVARVACELGLVGLALLAGWVGASWGLGRGEAKGAGPADPIRAAAWLGAAIVLFNGLFEYSFTLREMYLDFCLLLGIAAGARPGAKRQVWGRPLGPLVSTALALAALGVSWPALFRPDLTRLRQERSRAALEEAARARSEGDGMSATLWTGRALVDLESAQRLEPHNPWLLDSLAQIYQMPEQGDLAQARALAEEAVRRHPMSATLRDHLASILHALGEDEAAIAQWDRATGCHPRSPTPYADRAMALAEAGRWSLALADARRARELTLRSGQRYDDLYQRIEALRAAGGK